MKKLKVAAGHYHLFHRVAPTVAQAKGYFAKEGLEVEVSAAGTDLKSLQALIRDEIDIVIDLKSPVALRARIKEKEIFSLAAFSILTRESSLGRKRFARSPTSKVKRWG